MQTSSLASGKLKYRRILLKLSGEALMGDREFGLDPDILGRLAQELRQARELGVEIALVVGGGNIFRGTGGVSRGMDRVTADHMGMLATLINALALQDSLEQGGLVTRVLSGLEIPQVAELMIRRRALRHLERGRIVIFAAGTGNPFFTTDTAAALRAMEIKAEVLLKATRVEGIYTSDPEIDSEAEFLPELGYLEVLERGLGVMDTTAISLCMDNNLPIHVFSIVEQGTLMRVLQGEPIGSLVKNAKGDGS